jgi:hypothetical protein
MSRLPNLRLLSFVGPVLAATALGAGLAIQLTAGEADPLRWPLLGLLALIMFYQALVGWPGILGGLLRLVRHPVLTRPPDRAALRSCCRSITRIPARCSPRSA